MAPVSLRFHARFPAPPEVVFDALTTETSMSEWSGVRVERLAGDPHRRRIHLGAGISFDEEILVDDRPRRSLYKIVRGVGVTHHLGEILLSPANNGETDVEWHVNLTLAVPFIDRFVRRRLRSDLNAGLKRLSDRLSRARA